MKDIDNIQGIKGIQATLDELIKARPDKVVTGFSPHGKVNTHQWGSIHSKFLGRGMEFSESRPYQAGDDVRNIDWRITARTGKTHTKLFQEERERPIYLLVDMRSMMKFGTRCRFKSHMAAEIAAILAWVGYDGGDRVGGHILTQDGMISFKGARTRQSVLKFLERLTIETTLHPIIKTRKQEKQSTIEFNLAKATHKLRQNIKGGSMAFIISDFYDFDDITRQELIHLSLSSQVTLIQINDPLDMRLPPQGGKLGDGNTDIRVATLTTKQLNHYAHSFLNKQQEIQNLCLKHGITLHELLTSDDPKQILRLKK